MSKGIITPPLSYNAYILERLIREANERIPDAQKMKKNNDQNQELKKGGMGMTEENKILGIEINEDQTPNQFHNFMVSLEFIKPISNHEAKRILAEHMADMCVRDIEVY